ncbi:phospholipid-transporting ATPase ID-like [Branchiostoma lanceolatum]|uniref:phospholipid-transporting ATPase ID-like n=1 Tax=Branchiostoma lanceolatum TaxID=7740 RepID=UPI0034515BEF
MKDCLSCFRKKEEEVERKIRTNDLEYNQQFGYASNYISTSKYNVFTFLPINLFEQLQRVANAYFVILLILQVIPAISSLTPVTTAVPLVIVLSITALKDLVDDVRRHQSDNLVNNRKSQVLRNGRLTEENWMNVQVGDIIRMESDAFVAADLLLLSTSEPHGLCYIETAELDGETNLKCRQALVETAELGDDNHSLGQFNGHITCEPPNNKLDKYEGTLEWNGEKYSLCNDQIMLRGCVLRNTQWCYGVVVFAGQDTKLMMNSGQSRFKRTHIDQLMNVIVLWIFGFLVCMALICAIACGVWESYVGQYFRAYLPWEVFTNNPAEIASLVFLSYIIILNTVVPISLYVSVEIIRMGHSLFINWDSKMYYAPKRTPAKARTTTLNEELGQIEYVFSDKTGTLTQNIMAFNKCSINGKQYGDVYDRDGNPMDITEFTKKVDFSGNVYSDKSFTFYDQTLLDDISKGDENVTNFFRLLALCHTVMPEEKNGLLDYQAQSPDEGALVSAAKNFGIVFLARTPNTITIKDQDKEVTYELLHILDFNNVRKRMSVIVRTTEGKLLLLCKGADSIIYEHLSQNCTDLQTVTTEHLNKFACDGLRTLCLASKELDPNYYEEWKSRHHEASTSLEDRDEKLDVVYEEIEQDMMLLGATAIEDKLQDGVPDTIANLADANMKIWVLTGDKQETAINIGYSCNMLTDEMEDVFIVGAHSKEEVRVELANAFKKIKDMVGCRDVMIKDPRATSMVDMGDKEFALVINGHSLVYALEKEMEIEFLNVASLSKAVICCRVTPLQKALVVELVKKHKQAVTLAIGDGANDVSMIKAAHIGVGISGQEGMQAVLASDFSFAQFRYLERLLLVHGRWSYYRMCKFLKYFFYKNFAFTLCHFWYSFFVGFSAQTVYDQWFITFYNIMYTSLPVLAMALFDQDVNEDNCVKYPKLYVPGQYNLFFNKKIFLISLLHGVLTSLALFFLPYGAVCEAMRNDGKDFESQQVFGLTIGTALVITVSLQIGLDTAYWTGINHFFIWGSIAWYFGASLIVYSDGLYKLAQFPFVGVARNVFGQPTLWFTVLLTVLVCLLPVVAIRFLMRDLRPTVSDRIRLAQQLSKTSKRTTSQLLRRKSSRLSHRPSSRRSGYAFAHQEGFGRLITSGTIKMRQKKIGQRLSEHNLKEQASAEDLTYDV